MKIETIRIRGIEIGAGMPKICVPVIAKTAEDVIENIRNIAAKKPDCIELRIDWFEHVTDWNEILSLLQRIRMIIGDIVLLFTFRSKREGGEKDIEVEQYRQLCEVVCSSGYIDLIDIEAYMEDGLLQEMCEIAHKNKVYVVASNHDFNLTPSTEDLVARLEYMDKTGADIPKIAVMPQSERDVIHLLSATVAYYEHGGTKPVITMSMAGIGGITRLSGEIFGSALTFAAVSQCSAPGQLELSDAKHVLEIIHKNLQG
ncbi:MAG: type I 3-dehydroquinate dehydratase [Lachnospiraceae bacterium]|nr:type I 3-dehydroquinate dehydratase [Lachnospiraceae bacterium]